MHALKYCLLLLWGVSWVLLAMTSNAAQGVQFTAPVFNTAVHWLGYGLSLWVGWRLVSFPRWSPVRPVRGVLWTALGLQWVGLLLSWGVDFLPDYFPSPLGYFTSMARWRTDKVLFSRGSAQLVQQHLDPIKPGLTVAVNAEHRMPPLSLRPPAYPASRTVVIEPLVPGLQRVFCYQYVSAPNCGCCGWEDKLDASWTPVDTASATILRYSSDSARLKPLLARERAHFKARQQ